MNIDEAIKKINAQHWYHKFEILPSIWTPGKVLINTQAIFAHYKLPSDLTGKKVLDIGTCDGPVAFACEARGATVTALDIQDPERMGFNTACEILSSKVQYVRGSIYDGRIF